MCTYTEVCKGVYKYVGVHTHVQIPLPWVHVCLVYQLTLLASRGKNKTAMFVMQVLACHPRELPLGSRTPLSTGKLKAPHSLFLGKSLLRSHFRPDETTRALLRPSQMGSSPS